nr:hypothetical protein K-LCC10_0177 [Kaumoebavirus]
MSRKFEGEYEFVLKQSTIPGAGLGLFSLQDICRGTIIGKYEGRLYSENKIFSSIAQTYTYTNRFNEHIMPDLNKCPFAYINDIVDVPVSLMFVEIINRRNLECNLEWREDPHSHFPNILVTVDVQKGDELFISYGDGYWINRIRDPKFRKQFIVGGEVVQRYCIEKIKYAGMEHECDYSD